VSGVDRATCVSCARRVGLCSRHPALLHPARALTPSSVQTHLLSGCVGMIGIINGFFGVDENAYGPVIANTPDDPAGRVRFSLNPNFKE